MASRRPDALILLAASAFLALLGYRIALGHDRFLDNDELVHLNVAYFISQGETIYASFFENHPPLLAWALQPIVRLTNSPEAIISGARIGILIVQLGILALAAAIARRLAGRLCALMAPSLLLIQSFFYQKTLEVRPDVPGLLFFMLALERMGAPTPERGARRLCLIGAYLCIAGLFTPKLIYASTGAVLAFALAKHWGTTPRWRGALRSLVWIAIGGAAVAALVFAELARQGILAGFFQDAVLASLRMTIDDPAWFRALLATATLRLDVATWILTCIGIGLALYRPDSADRAEIAILLASGSAGVIGLFLINAPLPQYFLCFIPQAMIFAGWALARSIAAVDARFGALAAAGALALGLALCLGLPLRDHHQRALPHRRQLEVIDTVRAVTRPEERVFACWNGLYLTRLPAYRYFFLVSDVQRLLEPQRLQRDLLALLSRPEVSTYLHDPNCDALPKKVRLKLRQTFAPHPKFPQLLFVRRTRQVG